MDWRSCPAVEFRPDIHAGAALFKGTRLTVEDSILGNLEAGVPESELPLLFPVLQGREQELAQVIAFVRKHANAARSF